MDVVIAGAHGKVARRLTRLLHARGDRVRGLIRNPDHAADVRGDGAEPVVCDLERAPVDEVAEAIRGADAAVFAAGAGPGSGPARKATMDRDGAILLVRAAEQAGVPRYVMVSSIGAEDPPEGDEGMAPYWRAKAQADAALMESSLRWTVVRPGGLTEDPGEGRVRLTREPVRSTVTRDDVAAVLAAVLAEPRADGALFYVNGGEDEIPAALERVL